MPTNKSYDKVGCIRLALQHNFNYGLLPAAIRLSSSIRPIFQFATPIRHHLRHIHRFVECYCRNKTVRVQFGHERSKVFNYVPDCTILLRVCNAHSVLINFK